MELFYYTIGQATFQVFENLEGLKVRKIIRDNH